MNTNIVSIDDANELAYRGKTVKCLALIDIVFSFFYIMVSPFFAISAFLSIIFATCGYYGAKNYNISQVFYYTTFLIIQNIFRILIFLIYLANPSYFNQDKIYVGTVLLNLFSISINVYINYYIHYFYKILKSYSQEQLNALVLSPQVIIIPGTASV